MFSSGFEVPPRSDYQVSLDEAMRHLKVEADEAPAATAKVKEKQTQMDIQEKDAAVINAADKVKQPTETDADSTITPSRKRKRIENIVEILKMKMESKKAAREVKMQKQEERRIREEEHLNMLRRHEEHQQRLKEETERYRKEVAEDLRLRREELELRKKNLELRERQAAENSKEHNLLIQMLIQQLQKQ